jgi:hypothetical protein
VYGRFLPSVFANFFAFAAQDLSALPDKPQVTFTKPFFFELGAFHVQRREFFGQCGSPAQLFGRAFTCDLKQLPNDHLLAPRFGAFFKACVVH